MEEYYNYNYGGGGHVPAFGSWDWNNDLPFTQCFDSARQPAAGGFLRYSYSSEDRDLYLAGDLYQNDVVAPAVFVVPRRTKQGKVQNREGKTTTKQQKKEVGYNDCLYDVVKDPPSPPPPRRRTPKPVDEDLYKIPPELLCSPNKPKKKRAFGFFTSCLLPTCVV
ncbi:hypothetical protein LINGRAHAP2_LOCUS19486 [Linum grandiflorum]